MSKENSLFKEATIKRLISNVKITAKHKKAVSKWLEYFKSGKLENEKQAYIEFANIILRDLLDYDISLEGLKHEEENIEFLFKKNGDNLICFEAKGAKTKDLWAYQGRDKKSRETPVNQINSYMYDKVIPFGILTNYRLFVLFDRNEGSKKYHIIDFTELTNEEKLKEFIALFSREQVEKGFITEVIQQSIVEEREFTKEFYKLYHETRLMLIKEFEDNSEINREVSVHFAQLYLNRLMFVFFAEDTGKIDKRIIEDKLIKTLDNIHLFSSNSSNISNVLAGLFNDLDKGSDFPVKLFGFNGGLFKHPIPPKIFFRDFRDDKFFKDVNQYSKLKKKELELNENEQVIFNKYKNKLSPIIKNVLLMASFDFNSEVNVNILGHIFEQSISDIEDLKTDKSSRRKKEGIFYTPEYITDYICRNTIITYLSKKGINSVPELIKEYAENIEELEEKFKSIKILDPACGSGAFLIKATDVMLEIFKGIQEFKQSEGEYEAVGKKELKKWQKKGIKESTLTLSKWNEEAEAREIIENSIHGVDINEESVEITKLSLFLKMARKNRKLTDLSNNIKRGNSLINDSEVAEDLAFDWDKEFPSKFDVVIGNPPYVRVQNLDKHSIEYFKKNYKSAKGNFDLYLLFIERGYKLLREGGFFAFINPNKFFQSKNSRGLREYLSQTKAVKEILDFRSEQVFEDATTYTCILILNKNKNSFIDYKKVLNLIEEKSKLSNLKKVKIDYQNISDKEWYFLSEKEKNLFDKLGRVNSTLESLSHNISQGFKTGNDKIFINPNINIEPECSIKILKGEDIQRYSIQDSNRKAIFPYTPKDDKIVPMSELEFKNYKKSYDYLSKFKNLLLKRDNGKIKQDQWFLYSRNQFINLSKKKKIITRDISQQPSFTLDKDGEYGLMGGYGILLKEDLSYEYVLSLLNSKIVYWFISKISILFRGNYYSYESRFIERIPIPKISLSEQKPFIEKANLMLKLNKEFYDKKNKFFNRIKKSFSLEKLNKKIDSFYELEFNDFVKEIEKLSKKKLSLKEQDEWEDYFNEYKKDLLSLKDKIEKTDEEINKMVYKLYGLSKDEIQIIEESMR